MAWLELLNEIFTHKLQLCTVSLDQYGSQSITGVTTVCCYAWVSNDNSIDRGTASRTNYSQWQVVFESKDRALVKIGTVVREIVDADGETIVALAKIADIANYRHWSQGNLCAIAELELS